MPSASVRSEPDLRRPRRRPARDDERLAGDRAAGEAAIVALTTSAVPDMNGCSVQTNG